MPVNIKRYEEGAPADAGALFNGAAPRLHLVLTPYRALKPVGFVWFIAITAAFLSVPVLAVVGFAILWGLLPFVLVVLTGMWWALRRSWRDMEIREDLFLWDNHMRLIHQPPRGAVKIWEENPYWVRIRILPERGPVPDYVTLKGMGREVEIGAFLTPSERRELYGFLLRELRV